MKAKYFLIFALTCAVAQGAWATDYSVKNDSELRAAIANNNANITVTADIDLSNSTLSIAEGTTVTINLKEHTLDRHLTQRGEGGGQVITVRSGATLNLSNGTLKGGWGGNGGGIANEGGTANLTNVTITGCVADDRGGGIANGAGGTLTLNGCTITGNTSNDKTAPKGGGGIYNAGTLKMKGTNIITDNWDAESGMANNLFLKTDAVITVTGSLAGSSIGVKMESAGTFTSGYSTYNSGVDPTTIFTPDVHSITAVCLDGNEAKLGSSIPDGAVYITDVMLVGDYWKSDAKAGYNSYVQQGWTGINVDLNEGAGTTSHYIYLLYKTNNSPGTSGVPITDFYLRVSESGDVPNSFSYEGRTYQLTSYTNGSDDDFRNSKGDLNTNAGGDYKIHLYYTKGEYAPGRAVTSIDIVQPSTNALGNIASDVNVSPFLCENGLTTPCNLNKHAGGAFLCMSVTKALTEPVTVPDGGVYYIEHGWDNVNKKLTGTVQTLASGEFTKLSDKTGDLTLTAGNYVVQGNVHVEDVIFVTGNTNLILCDGATLKVAKGILVSQDCTLSIFGQAANSGRLVNEQEQENSSDKNVYPGIGTFSSGTTINIHGGTIDVKAKNAYAAAIGNGYGNNKNHEMGTINIYDGKITATGGYTGYEGAAAIGSWDNRANGAVNIHGGNITASSVYYGPAIGTGNCSDEASETVFTITINGGNVVATGGLQAAGIGGGYECVGSTVTINGGRVEAHGGNGGAGIGSGQNNEPISGGTVVVNGGEVYAYGGEIPVGGAAGIGGGEGCHGADVTVNGGKVYAYGVDNAAGIGSGNKHNMDSKPNGGKLTVTGGYVYAKGEGKGAGIGGGEDGAGADVTITGGIVVAQSGGDQRAIGAGYGSDNHGSLTFADDLGVFVTTDLNRSQKANRVIDCRNFAYVRVDQCAHGEHLVTGCKWCYAGEEIHTFGDYGECAACGLVSLKDAADNSATIAHWNNTEKAVTLQGRKLWKDGAWNTLCLPFNASLTGDFADATLMELDVEGTYDTDKKTGFDDSDGTLYLYFKNASSIVAGKAYIIKWAATEPNYIENPVFSNVTISDDLVNVMSADGALAFVGTYSPHIYTETNKSILFLGDENTLYYPQPSEGKNPRVNACRAYFQLYGIEAGDIANARMNFEDGSQTSIGPAERAEIAEIKADAWYTVNGVRLSGKPSQKGVYIHGGRKVVIK